MISTPKLRSGHISQAVSKNKEKERKLSKRVFMNLDGERTVGEMFDF